MPRLTLQTACLALLGTVVSGRASADDAAATEVEDLAQVRAEARPLYVRFCAPCHGVRGDGRGPAAAQLRAPPHDLTRGELRFRSTPYGAQPLTLDLYRVITKGLNGTAMPGWERTLTAAERWRLARYVGSLATVERPRAEAVLPATLSLPVDDGAAVARGAALFAKMQCAQCHGEAGRGDGPVAATLVDSEGRHAPPTDLQRGVLKGGRGAVAVYRAITTGLSGTPMPSFAAVLDEQQRWDVARYVASLAAPKSLWSFLFEDPAGRESVP